jgi:hypothetical protein
MDDQVAQIASHWSEVPCSLELGLAASELGSSSVRVGSEEGRTTKLAR